MLKIKMSNDLTHPKYRKDIDGLRAVAVLSVVAFHAFPNYVRGGFVGVDIFFVISGYLISTIIIGNLGLSTFGFIEFYSRRIKRIFPALLLVMISCLAFGWFALLADEYKQLGKHIAGGSGFISNLLFWNESGYFDNSSETKPLLHLWSLGIEEQFYIVWPLLLWVAWRKRVSLKVIIITIGIASFILSIYTIRRDSVAAFFSPQTRFWELLVGSVLAYMTLHKQLILPKLLRRADIYRGYVFNKNNRSKYGVMTRDFQSIVGATLIISSVLIITKFKQFPGLWAILPTSGAVIVISAGSQAWFNRVVLSNRLFVWIGLISFPLYLWHWPLLSFATIIESTTPSYKIKIAVICISILLSWLTYKLIETPIRFGEYGHRKSVLLFFLMAVVGSLGYICYKNDGFSNRDSIRHTQLANLQFVGPLWKYTKNDICLNRYPLKGSESYGWWFCMANRDENPTLLLLGNSYANQFYAGFANNIEFRNQSILSIGTCDPAWIDEAELSKEVVNNSPCSGYRGFDQQQLINSIVEKSGSVKYAIVSGLSGKPDDSYIYKIKKRIDFLEQNNVKVIVFVPHIKVDYDIKGCYSRPFKEAKRTCEVPAKLYESHLENFMPLVRQMKNSNPKVLYFNPNELFCNTSRCSFLLNKMPVFRDEYHHLSEYASIEVVKYFENWARINAPDLF